MIGCRLAGAERIIASTCPRTGCRGAAPRRDRDDGSQHDDTVDWIRSETGGFGADYTFEATGNVQVMQQAVEAAREAWGLATMIGVAGKGETLDIVPRLLITGRRVTGSSFGGVKGRSQVPAARRPLARRRDRRRRARLHQHYARRGERGFELMERQDGIRTVVTFG